MTLLDVVESYIEACDGSGVAVLAGAVWVSTSPSPKALSEAPVASVASERIAGVCDVVAFTQEKHRVQRS